MPWRLDHSRTELDNTAVGCGGQGLGHLVVRHGARASVHQRSNECYVALAGSVVQRRVSKLCARGHVDAWIHRTLLACHSCTTAATAITGQWRTLSRALTCAPLLRSCDRTASWPRRTAKCSGVLLYCGKWRRGEGSLGGWWLQGWRASHMPVDEVGVLAPSEPCQHLVPLLHQRCVPDVFTFHALTSPASELETHQAQSEAFDF